MFSVGAGESNVEVAEGKGGKKSQMRAPGELNEMGAQVHFPSSQFVL